MGVPKSSKSSKSFDKFHIFSSGAADPPWPLETSQGGLTLGDQRMVIASLEELDPGPDVKFKSFV
jgi:hypothetical protein